MATAQISKTLTGKSLYQQRAREALPILVRQAHAGEPITYGDLATELEMPNPRNLNYVLGCIGQSMIAVGKQWKSEVPPIQCLVVNKNTGLPGEGISEFFGSLAEYGKLSRKQRRQVVDAELTKIYSYPKWLDVIRFYNLPPAAQDFAKLVDQAKRFRAGGEGDAHQAMKDYVANHPEAIGLRSSLRPGAKEYPLPSGDFVDVVFLARNEYIAVEVKPAASGEVDITRGLFQCIKYGAVLEALQASRGLTKNVRTILILGGALPKSLVALKNCLGIEVVEGLPALNAA